MSLASITAIGTLLSYWPMQEAAGDDIDASAGSEPVDLIRYGATLAQPGIVPSRASGKSILLDGTLSNYLRCALHADWRAKTIITTFCAIKTDAAWPVGYLYHFAPAGANATGRGVQLVLYDTGIVSARKGVGADPWNIFLSTAAGVIAANTAYAVFSQVGNTGMSIHIRAIEAHAASDVVPSLAANADVNAITWSDQFPGSHYPDPGQLYVGGTRSDAVLGGADPLGPDQYPGNFWISDLALFSGALSNTQRSSIYRDVVGAAPTGVARRGDGSLSHRRARARGRR